MAWISVHEQVVGGKLRTLAKELNCSQNEALGMLVTLWLWGINNADSEGKIIGATRADIAKVLYVGLNEEIDPLKAVDALITTGWIDLDTDLYLHDWGEWQEQWYKAMTAREKDKERKRRERAAKKLAPQQKAPPVKKEEPAISTSEPTIPQQPETKSKAEGYTKDFEEWWSVYPRKIGKGDAYKKYKTRIKDGWSPAEMLEAAQNYRTKVLNERTEQKFIKHPKTFLSDTTPFADFIKTGTPTVTTTGNNDDNPYAVWEELHGKTREYGKRRSPALFCMRRADTEDFTVPAYGRFGRNSGYESTYHVFLREERAGCLRQGTEATGRNEGRRGIEKTQPYG